MHAIGGELGSRFHIHIHSSAVTLPGFRGRTTINPVDTEQTNTRRQKQSKSETVCTDNWFLRYESLTFILIQYLLMNW